MIMNSTKLNGKEISFIIFDLDGVLADTISSWVWVHEHYGVNNDVAYYAYMNDEIDDKEFMRRDIALWLDIKNRLHVKEITRILDSVPIMPGFYHTMKCLRYLNIDIAIVSAGLELLADRIAKLGRIKHVIANTLETDARGFLTGEGILRVGLKAKGEAVEELLARHGLEPGSAAAVGNGAIDIPMFNASGLGIAFNPHDQQIVESADVVIYKKDLTEILKYVCDMGSLPKSLRP